MLILKGTIVELNPGTPAWEIVFETDGQRYSMHSFENEIDKEGYGVGDIIQVTFGADGEPKMFGKVRKD